MSEAFSRVTILLLVLSLLDKLLKLTVEVVEALEEVERVVVRLVVHTHSAEGLDCRTLFDFGLDQPFDIGRIFYVLRMFG